MRQLTTIEYRYTPTGTVVRHGRSGVQVYVSPGSASIRGTGSGEEPCDSLVDVLVFMGELALRAERLQSRHPGAATQWAAAA